eukprot:CFRG4760T1
MGAASKRGRDSAVSQAVPNENLSKKGSKSKQLDIKANLTLGDDGTDTDESEYSGLDENDEEEADIDEAEAFGLVNQSADESSNDAESASDNSDEVEVIVSENEIVSGDESDNEYAYEHRGGWAGYEDSDSDDEIPANTVGNIPMEWYDEYEHVGYDLDGKKVLKSANAGEDEIDHFLDKMDNPDYWRTVKDKTTGEQIVLTNEELDIIHRIQGRMNGAGEDQFPEHVDFFTNEVMIHPLGDAPEPKRRFIPSVWEHKKVMKIVRAIRDGRIKPGARDNKEKKSEDSKKIYEMWSEGDVPTKEHYMHMPAPKMKLPGHEESYNPPDEYLMSNEEKEDWNATDKEDRENNFIPTKYAALRLVPRYENYIQERFERCLDLYLCPRGRKNRVNIDPESLIPKLPKPKELQPFPIACVVDFVGHTSNIVSISTDPTGQWLASVSLDRTLRLWETVSGRCVKIISLGNEEPACVAWNPNPEMSVIAVAAGQEMLIFNPRLGAVDAWEAVDTALTRVETADGTDAQKSVGGVGAGVVWSKPSAEERERTGLRIRVSHSTDVSYIAWHRRGDYVAAVIPECPEGVAIHQLSRSRSQTPFQKSKGAIQRVLFHPTRPIFFVATQRYVRVYNLSSQELIKKLITGVKWVSSMDVHPGGDNLIIGSYDRRLCWFDLDLSVRPYKTLRYHTQALRGVAYHPKYPLFASGSDDGKVHVFHGRVFNDLNQNALIVPVKVLEGHTRTNAGVGVMDVKFHPTQPWLFTCSATGELKMWT